jgi:AraC-like DNA-binding protein
VVAVPVGRGPELVRAWRPPIAGVREVLHARFVDHAYPPHTHDAWTLLLVDEGAVTYRLERHDHGSHRSVVTVLPPHVAHDGRSARPDGFRKQVLYLDPAVVGEERIGRAVDEPSLTDPALARRLRELHVVLAEAAPVIAAGPGHGLADADALADAGEGSDEAFEAETRLALVVEAVRAHLDRRPGRPPVAPPAPPPDQRPLASALRDLLDAQVPVDGRAAAGSATLAQLGRVVGASPTHLVRSFTGAFGVPPHAYLVARRVEVARRLLLAGRSPAEVAVVAGFHDQAHLTRHFRRHVGTTPARYRAGRTGHRASAGTRAGGLAPGR